jgi:hypothetical protein
VNLKKVLEERGTDIIEVISWHLSKAGVLKFCAGIPINENLNLNTYTANKFST